MSPESVPVGGRPYPVGAVRNRRLMPAMSSSASAPAAPRANTSRAAAAVGRNVFGGCGEAEDRHVAIDTLILAGIDGIGFVPNAHSAITANALVKRFPGFGMGIFGVARELF